MGWSHILDTGCYVRGVHGLPRGGIAQGVCSPLGYYRHSSVPWMLWCVRAAGDTAGSWYLFSPVELSSPVGLKQQSTRASGAASWLVPMVVPEGRGLHFWSACLVSLSPCPLRPPTLLCHHPGKPNAACLQVQGSRLLAAPCLAPGHASEDVSSSNFSLVSPVGCGDSPQNGTQKTSWHECPVHTQEQGQQLSIVQKLGVAC